MGDPHPPWRGVFFGGLALVVQQFLLRDPAAACLASPDSIIGVANSFGTSCLSGEVRSCFRISARRARQYSR